MLFVTTACIYVYMSRIGSALVLILNLVLLNSTCAEKGQVWGEKLQLFS